MPITSTQLKDYINANIKKNGKQSITGVVMNDVLTKIHTYINEQTVGGIVVNSTPVTGGEAHGVLFQRLDGKVSQDLGFRFNQSLSRLSIGMGAAPGAKLDIRAELIESNDVLRIRNNTNTASLFWIRGDGLFNFSGTTGRFGNSGVATAQYDFVSPYTTLAFHYGIGYISAGDGVHLQTYGSDNVRVHSDGIILYRGNLNINHPDGAMIGISNYQKMGFWGTTPVVQQDLPNNPTTAEIATLLGNIGLANLT